MNNIFNYLILLVLVSACQSMPNNSDSPIRGVASQKTDNARIAVIQSYLNTSATLAQAQALIQQRRSQVT